MPPLDLPARPRFLVFDNRSFSAEEIGELLARPAILGLTFTDCRIGDEQVRALCSLPKLERLWLEGCDITDAVLPDIAAIPRLNWLNLDRTRINGSGLHAFAAHAKLSTLSARHTLLDDAVLPQLLGLTGVSHLGLEGTGMSQAGIMALAALPTVHLGRADAAFAAIQEAFICEQRRLADRTAPGFIVVPAEREAIEATLRGFFEEMSDWETALALRDRTAMLEDDWNQQECIAIFERFCTAKDRKYGRPNALSFASPPEYGEQRVLLIEWLSASKACVYCLGSRLDQHRFVMIKKAGQWRIDHRQALLTGWDNVSL